MKQTEEWRTFDKEVLKITTPEVAHIISTGARSISGEVDINVYRTEFLTSQTLQDTMREQQSMGWNHFLMGRLSRSWAHIGPTEAFKDKPGEWSRKMAGIGIRLGLTLWKQWNQILHGNDGGVSKVDILKAGQTIRQIHEEIYPYVHPAHKWLFHLPQEERLAEPYQVQIAWIDGIRRLYPRQFEALRQSGESIDLRPGYREYIKEQRIRKGTH